MLDFSERATSYYINSSYETVDLQRYGPGLRFGKVLRGKKRKRNFFLDRKTSENNLAKPCESRDKKSSLKVLKTK